MAPLRELSITTGQLARPTSGTQGETGPQGPQGPPGPPGTGTGGASFEHVQTDADVLWDIQHNLHYFPSVTVVVDGQVVDTDVTHIDNDHLTVGSSVAIAGTAYLI